MQSKGVERCRMERQRNAPAQQARRVNQFRWGGHERRHVDRLADVAGGFRTPFVLVDKRGARVRYTSARHVITTSARCQKERDTGSPTPKLADD